MLIVSKRWYAVGWGTALQAGRFFFFFFNRRYNPWWVLACFTISFHNLLSLHFSLQFLTFIFFRSSSTWSSHLSLGIRTGLDERGSHSVTFLTILVVSILTTCAAHRNLCDFINLTIFGTQVRGFKPGRSRQIFKGEKNPQHVFLRRGSKAVCPMSQICGM